MKVKGQPLKSQTVKNETFCQDKNQTHVLAKPQLYYIEYGYCIAYANNIHSKHDVATLQI